VTRRLLHLIGTLTVGAVFASACSDAPDSPWAIEDTTPVVNDADEPAADTIDENPVNPLLSQSTHVIIEEECFGDEVRCGRVLVPHTSGSDDRVAVGFRVLADDGAGRPLVVLEGPNDLFRADPTSIPDRPIIVIGARTRRPGGPGLSCPEWFSLDADATDDDIGAATDDCVDRHAVAGIDFAAATRARRAADVIDVLAALGALDSYDVVTVGNRADLIPLLEEASDVVRRVMIEPVVAPSDPILRSTDRLTLALGAAWERCIEVPSCEPTDTVDAFLALVAELDDDPIAFTISPGEDNPDIDAAWFVSALHREAPRVENIAFFPVLHRALLDRDADTISAFVASGTTSTANADWLAPACALFTVTPADLEPLPAAIRADAEDSLRFFSAACAAVGAEAESALEHRGGLVIATSSTAHLQGISTYATAVLIEPTIGAPTHDCVAAAINAYTGSPGLAVDACEQRPEVRDPSAPIVLVRGEYVYDDTISVTLVVPDTWVDSGFGTWWREATPLDNTNLDVYVWLGDQLEDARQDFVEDWSISEPSFSDQDIDGRRWLFVEGGDEWDDTGTARQVVALTEIDDAIVALVLQADVSEMDELRASVLTPALGAVDLS
jgi:hypothetical protein